jgi:radial spoke head protein 4A
MEPETPDNAPDDFDIEVVKKQIEAADPYEPRLKSITLDYQVDVATNGAKQPMWHVKLVGDKELYTNPADPKSKVNYGVVIVKSLIWPGAFTFYYMGRYLSVYMGYG